MTFRHRFRVRAPLTAVAAFHRSSENLAAITPPPLRVTIEQRSSGGTGGDVVTLRLRVGPFSLRWVLQVQEVAAAGFVDRQLHGPFRRWEHRHIFVPVTETTTDVVDIVQASLRPHPLWAPLGLVMWLGLPLLFAYRAWKTRWLLSQPRRTG
jgi:ligand-binding SRPBCC domain-containing protein